jgi:hypothetical protein
MCKKKSLPRVNAKSKDGASNTKIIYSERKMRKILLFIVITACIIVADSSSRFYFYTKQLFDPCGTSYASPSYNICYQNDGYVENVYFNQFLIIPLNSSQNTANIYFYRTTSKNSCSTDPYFQAYYNINLNQCSVVNVKLTGQDVIWTGAKLQNVSESTATSFVGKKDMKF